MTTPLFGCKLYCLLDFDNRLGLHQSNVSPLVRYLIIAVFLSDPVSADIKSESLHGLAKEHKRNVRHIIVGKPAFDPYTQYFALRVSTTSTGACYDIA